MACIKLILYDSSSSIGLALEKHETIFLLKLIWLTIRVVCPECLKIQSVYGIM